MDEVMINNFGLSVLTHRGLAFKKNINEGNYFLLSHGDNYKLKLFNHRSTKCDADVSIDGEHIGTWRINPHDHITIERPTSINRKFVFLRENSGSARRAGIKSGKGLNGLVEVKFTPETDKYFHPCDHCEEMSPFNDLSNSRSLSANMSSANMSSNMSFANMSSCFKQLNYSSHGATALGKRSHQDFYEVSSLHNIDYHNITTILVRLLIDEDNNHYYREPLISLDRAMYRTKFPSRLDRFI
jgi:hypothetical protein